MLTDRAHHSRSPGRRASLLVLPLFSLLHLACGPAAPAPSFRADLPRSRHVLLIPPLDEHPKLVDHHDGTALDDSTSQDGKPDLAWCARVCAVVARPDERVLGCFSQTVDTLLLRVRSFEMLDCAMAPPPSAAPSIDAKARR
ncbi:MAG: hypothetical protein ABJE95_34710 [Byssovorax sp.]